MILEEFKKKYGLYSVIFIEYSKYKVTFENKKNRISIEMYMTEMSGWFQNKYLIKDLLDWPYFNINSINCNGKAIIL